MIKERREFMEGEAVLKKVVVKATFSAQLLGEHTTALPEVWEALTKLQSGAMYTRCNFEMGLERRGLPTCA